MVGVGKAFNLSAMVTGESVADISQVLYIRHSLVRQPGNKQPRAGLNEADEPLE